MTTFGGSGTNLAEKQAAPARKEMRRNVIFESREMPFTSETFKTFMGIIVTVLLRTQCYRALSIAYIAFFTASSGVSTAMISPLTSQVSNPITGFPKVSAMATSERVP